MVSVGPLTPQECEDELKNAYSKLELGSHEGRAFRPVLVTAACVDQQGQGGFALSPSNSRLPWSAASYGEGTGDPLQCSCLENPVNGGAWWAAVHGVMKSRTRLSDFTLTFHFHAFEKKMATHSSILA